MKKNLLTIFTFFCVLAGYTQTCETTALQEGLYSPSLTITCDFDGNGSEDIVFLDSLSNNLLWKRNNGSDSFSAPLSLVGGAPIEYLLSADLNDDGYDEIIIATSSVIYYILYTGPGTIEFAELYTIPVLYTIDALAIGDFDVDGNDGLVVGYSRSSTLNAFVDVINNDDASLSLQNIFEGTIGTISDLAVGDITGNTRPDIAMAGYSNFWFRNTGAGTFTSYTTISSASSDFGRIALQDHDGDDEVELLVLNNSGELLSYGIDISGEGWIYSPVTLLSGLPTSPQTWEHTSLNGEEVLLLSSATDIIGLVHTGTSYTEETFCAGIDDLNGLTLFHRENGLIEFVFSREDEGTIEKVNEAETNTIEEVVTNSFNLYPNPARDFLNIVSESGIAIQSVEAVSLSGKRIPIQSIGNGQYAVSELATGLYQLIITDLDGNINIMSFSKMN